MYIWKYADHVSHVSGTYLKACILIYVHDKGVKIQKEFAHFPTMHIHTYVQMYAKVFFATPIVEFFLNYI